MKAALKFDITGMSKEIHDKIDMILSRDVERITGKITDMIRRRIREDIKHTAEQVLLEDDLQKEIQIIQEKYSKIHTNKLKSIIADVEWTCVSDYMEQYIRDIAKHSRIRVDTVQDRVTWEIEINEPTQPELFGLGSKFYSDHVNGGEFPANMGDTK